MRGLISAQIAVLMVMSVWPTGVQGQFADSPELRAAVEVFFTSVPEAARRALKGVDEIELSSEDRALRTLLLGAVALAQQDSAGARSLMSDALRQRPSLSFMDPRHPPGRKRFLESVRNELLNETVVSEPTYTPYTVAPEVINRTEVVQALEREYPRPLRDAGISGTARVWFFIDEDGRVQDRRLQESSGHAQLDEAALNVAGVMRFTPALNRDKKVPVWVAIPITFRLR